MRGTEADIRPSHAFEGPAVGRDDASAAFFDAAARQRLVVRQCIGGHGLFAPELERCPRCGGVLGWIDVSGHAQLVSWAVVHRSPHPAFAELVPFVTAVVELDEGPWLHARLVVDDASRLEPGIALDVAFAQPPGGESVPYFVVATGGVRRP